MIVKEWVCLAHGDFDGAEPACPRGCSGSIMVQRAFRTPVGIQSTSFRNINGTLQSLADEHHLTDMRQRGGDGMRKADSGTYQRLQSGVDELGAARNGMPIRELFQPTSQAQLGAPEHSGLHRTEGGGMAVTMNGTTIPIVRPTPRLEAPAFDGRAVGVPQGDA